MPLEVALQMRQAEAFAGTFWVGVRVYGGRAPLRLMLYCDGDLAGACDSVADVYEFRGSAPAGLRHAVTVRVVDADGRWGAASETLRWSERAQDSAAGEAAGPARFALTSSVRTRVLTAGV
ncbi:MAG: hypothetical protein ACREJV_04280 [Candidatus Rokuibacteriota bacterium]